MHVVSLCCPLLPRFRIVTDWSLGFQPGLLRALFGKMKDFRQGLPTFVPSIWDNVHGLEKTRVVGMISFMWQGGQLFVWC